MRVLSCGLPGSGTRILAQLINEVHPVYKPNEQWVTRPKFKNQQYNNKYPDKVTIGAPRGVFFIQQWIQNNPKSKIIMAVRHPFVICFRPDMGQWEYGGSGVPERADDVLYRKDNRYISNLKRERKLGLPSHTKKNPEKYAKMALTKWSDTIHNARKACEKKKIPLLEVKYEDITSDTQGTLDIIADFLEKPRKHTDLKYNPVTYDIPEQPKKYWEFVKDVAEPLGYNHA